MDVAPLCAHCRTPIGHVCAAAPAGCVVTGAEWAGWEGRRPEGSRLSDHSGVAVTVQTVLASHGH